ncbi:exonuclease domain-containing protein [Lacticaseibacillus mingshuiensis]|uniref:exonuclease domain-containing protein n=1 Tax=Lacticaseibacillus mingshuiensis TaxID=2799574 RepID=UPI0019507F33|nr:exonuclease domain-containing protein [Lacticaseibacillus mingshuiensis]
MFVQPTTKTDFDETIARYAPYPTDRIDENNLLVGDVVALWWFTQHPKFPDVYSPKYFRRIYAVDLPTELGKFIQDGYLVRQDERLIGTNRASALISEFEWIIKAHRAGSQDLFYEKRKALASRDISRNPGNASIYQLPSHPDLASDFISLDIETTGTNYAYDDVIQVSATHVMNGLETENFTSFIDPAQSVPAHITNLTGIRQEDVDNAPKLNELADELMSFIGDRLVIGWNLKGFDLPFLKAKGIDLTNNSILDVMLLARRRKHQGVNSQLTTVKHMLGVKALSHNALTDARATEVLYALLLSLPSVASAATGGKIASTNSTVFNYTDTTPLFENMRFVFTGTIDDGQYTRKQMEYIVKSHGGTVGPTLTEKTDYYVEGVQTAHNLTDGETSSKERKYLALQEAGVDIYKMNGQDFDKLLRTSKEQFE